MSFYVIDDLKQILEDTSKNPNARARYRWSPAFPINKRGTEADFCPTCGLPVSMMHWAQPRILSFRGKKFADRLWENIFTEFVVSKRFKDLYEQNGITGVASFEQIDEIRVPQKLNIDPPIYYVAKVPFSQEIIVDSDSSIVTGNMDQPPCPVCNPFGMSGAHRERIVLDTKNWQGTDVLNVYFVGLVFSQRFYDFIQDNKLTNFPLTEIGSYHWV